MLPFIFFPVFFGIDDVDRRRLLLARCWIARSRPVAGVGELLLDVTLELAVLVEHLVVEGPLELLVVAAILVVQVRQDASSLHLICNGYLLDFDGCVMAWLEGTIVNGMRLGFMLLLRAIGVDERLRQILLVKVVIIRLMLLSSAATAAFDRLLYTLLVKRGLLPLDQVLALKLLLHYREGDLAATLPLILRVILVDWLILYQFKLLLVFVLLKLLLVFVLSAILFWYWYRLVLVFRDARVLVGDGVRVLVRLLFFGVEGEVWLLAARVFFDFWILYYCLCFFFRILRGGLHHARLIQHHHLGCAILHRDM